MDDILKQEILDKKIIPKAIPGTKFLLLRKATLIEKRQYGHFDRSGYSWYICTCGNYVLKRNNSLPKICNCNSNRGKRHFSKEDKENIIAYYTSTPMTQQQIAEKFNISIPTIEKIFAEYKVKEWNKAQIFSPKLEEHYFDIINTEQKAYFLGLMITNGNIFDNYKSANHQANVNITLQEQDKYILEIFKKELKCNKQVTQDGRGCCQLAIMSNLLKIGLAQYGVVPQKTLHTVFPKIPDEFYSHLLRGIIDGDGSVGFYSKPGRKTHSRTIRLCSANKEFLQEIQTFLLNKLQIQPNKIIQEKENLWSIGYGNKDALEKIINYLYNNATIYLTRKKEKCDLILEEIRKYRDN